MRICAVELKANEAVICLLEKSKQLYELPDCRVRRLALSDIHSRQALLDFQFAFRQLMGDYKIDKVIIRQRQMKGKFAGGAVSFKLESAIQLIDDLDVEIINASNIKASLKENPLPITFEATGLKVFQETAFKTAFAYLANI
jgi:hypothetical protein